MDYQEDEITFDDTGAADGTGDDYSPDPENSPGSEEYNENDLEVEEYESEV